MQRAHDQAESWKKMVMRAQSAPGWLSADAPYCDVILSSRYRVMRNLRGFRFPHHATVDELLEISRQVLHAGRGHFEAHRRLTGAERDYLVGCRLISPDFAWQQLGRSVLLDAARECSVMVNEEDHIRLQVITAGWSIRVAKKVAESALGSLGKELVFARDDEHSFVAASPYNAGEGKRLSAMLHLIGLASTKRLPSVLQALPTRGLSVRGLFGESSRAVGAFVQVSASSGSQTPFIGACEHLLREERIARREVSAETIAAKTRRALEFALPSRTLSLADALRVVAWIRWAACAGVPGHVQPRLVDSWLIALEVPGLDGDFEAGRQRARFIRERIEQDLEMALRGG
ncbi:MAG: hypothetical protein WAO58_08015 [Fimbriimonadaceae bacterium]